MESISEQIKKEAHDYALSFIKRNDIKDEPQLAMDLYSAFAAGASLRESLAGKEGGKISENDMTVEEFYSGFNLDFMTEEERQTIYTATELYAKGKLRQASQPSTGMREALEEIERLKNLLLDVYHDYQWGKIVDEMSEHTTTEQKMELRKRIDEFEKTNNL